LHHIVIIVDPLIAYCLFTNLALFTGLISMYTPLNKLKPNQ